MSQPFVFVDLYMSIILIVLSLLYLCHCQPVLPRPGGAGAPMMPGRVNVPIPFRPDPRRAGMPNPMVPGGTNINNINRQRVPGTRNGGGNGQPVNPSNAGPTCSPAGRGVISQCFQTNAGVQMQQVVGLLSNGSQAPLPSNADRLRSRICAADGVILACIFAGVNALRGSRQCPTITDHLRLEQETVGLISGLQQMCGKGPLAAPTPCLRQINTNLRECYTKVGLDADMFSPKDTSVTPGSASKIIGGVIGENEKEAKKFCRVKERLFDCLKTKIDLCPGSMEVLALSGFDHESLRSGIDVLCRDIDDYVKGLSCFKKPTPQVGVCYNSMIEKVTALSMEQVRRPMPLPQFYDRFCQYKLTHMDCDLEAWRRRCERVTVGLKTEFECGLLPTKCKNDPKIQSQLSQTCAKERFERHLRSGTTRTASVSLIATALLSLMAAVVL